MTWNPETHPFWHGSMPMSAVLAEAGPDEVLVGGEGSWLIDAAGRRFLDARAGIANVLLGYSRHDVVEAMHKQALALPFASTFRHERPAEVTLEYAEALVAAAPDPLRRVRFTHTGSSAVEAAIHMARLYHRNHDRPERLTIVGMQGAFHGSTMVGMAASGMPMLHQLFGPMPEGFHQVAMPDFAAESAEECAKATLAELTGLDPETVAAVILAPVVGLGVPLPAPYVRAIRRFCDDHGILLIFDEVTTGFGRSGPMFAAEGLGVDPDILCLAKAITAGYAALGAVLVTDDVYHAFDLPGRPFFYHGSSTDAHPVACAAALAVLRAYQNEDVVARGQEMSARLRAALTDAVADLPSVADVAGTGAFFVLDLVGPDGAPASAERIRRIQLHCRERGVFIDHTAHVLGLVPPLTFAEREQDIVVETVATALRA
ncbi:aspartate aminotransferase family protein [Amycolatopsis arida]|uniref:aminotransferase family protein n=1 Tax=Amycolatopsis arida TaxID=587909 RepID=UPI0014170A7F|nr:aminotransferase class III-fold pyridoxal phosphate-dependent enzyme [Amycolatopsis arida]